MARGDWRDPAQIIEERQQDETNYPVRKAMTTDESKQIEELLDAWYAWQEGYRMPLGSARVSPSCRGFAEDRRFEEIEDRTNEAERKAAKRQAEQIDVCVDALHWQQRSAIQFHFKEKRVRAMNQEDGASVWRNPRAFDFTSGPHVAYREAKFALLPALRARGMIKSEVTS